MRAALAVPLLVAALAVPSSAAEPPPEKGPMLVVGHVAGVVYERDLGEGVIALDTLLVIDGNVVEQGEQPEAAQQRRTWVGGVEVRCDLAARTCALGDWFLTRVPAGSFVYDAVRGEARLHARIGKKTVLDHYLVATGDRPGVLRPGAGWTPDGTELVVTGGVGVTRAVTATGNLFGEEGDGVGGVISGVVHNVYLDSPVGERIDLSNLLP